MNLIGEHIDYCDGFVLPIVSGIHLDSDLIAVRDWLDSGRLRLVSYTYYFS